MTTANAVTRRTRHVLGPPTRLSRCRNGPPPWRHVPGGRVPSKRRRPLRAGESRHLPPEGPRPPERRAARVIHVERRPSLLTLAFGGRLKPCGKGSVCVGSRGRYEARAGERRSFLGD